jgi:hypothetical protein
MISMGSSIINAILIDSIIKANPAKDVAVIGRRPLAERPAIHWRAVISSGADSTIGRRRLL